MSLPAAAVDRLKRKVAKRALDIDVLRSFIGIVQYGSFIGAARALHKTQSTLSMQIRRLEDQLAASLVERKRSGVVLTPAGVTFLGSARQILSINDDVFERRHPVVVSGHVRIGAVEHYATSVLPIVIARFCAAYPEVFVEIRTGIPEQSKSEWLTNYDLVVGVSEAGCGEGTLLKSAKVVWATSRQYDPHLKRPLPLALYPEGALFGRWAITALDRSDCPWRIAYRSNNVAVLRASVEAGLGVGVFDEASLTPALRALTRTEGFPALPRADIWISTPDNSASRATRALHDHIVEAIRDVPRRRNPRNAASMPLTLYGIKNCDTMKKARAWLDAQGVAYGFHDYRTDGIDEAKLKAWCKTLGWETLLNKSGTTFRKLADADRADLTEAKAIALMLAQPSLVKRPVLERDDGPLLVGFKPDLYAKALKSAH